MIELTEREITALLWHIHAIDRAYGTEPPEGGMIAALKVKLQGERSRLQGDSVDKASPER